MMKKIWFTLLLCQILNLGNCDLSEKEYARLPPIFELDNYDRCMLLDDEALYCSLEFRLKPKDSKNSSTAWKQIEELTANPKNYHHDLLRHGICVPLACPNINVTQDDPKFKEALAYCYSKKYEEFGLYGQIEEMFCHTKNPAKYDSLDIFGVIFFTAYSILVIYATFYEGTARYKSPDEYAKITGTKYGKILSCFSIAKNWDRLKSVRVTPELEQFKSFQGVRFIFMLIVIFAHAAMMAVMGPVSNTRWSESMTENPGVIILASGPYAVEVFFILSAWFLTYNIFKDYNVDSKRDFNLKTAAWMLLYRFFRLTPPFAFIILFHSTILYHLGNGPWWDFFVLRERNNCRMNGWTNLLFLNNQIEVTRMCFNETWYLAVDMQNFIMVVLILYFTVKKPKRLMWLLPLLWIIVTYVFLNRILSRGIYHLVEPHPENLYLMRELYRENNRWIETVASTKFNIISSLCGMTGGYLHYRYRDLKINIQKIHQITFWLYTYMSTLGTIILSGMWIFSKNYYPSKWFTILYFGTGTTIFGSGMCFGLLSMAKGIGGATKWVFEWSPFYILGRLSFCIFLVHYAYCIVRVASSRQLFHSSEIEIVIFTLETSICCLIIGLLLCLFVEMPVSALQNIFLKTKFERGQSAFQASKAKDS